MKKILFCNNLLGGLLLFRKNVIDHFIGKGYEVVLVAIKGDAASPNVETLGNGVRVYSIDVSRTSTNPFNDLQFFFQLFKILRSEKPSYVFNYTIKPNIYGAMACKLLGIPCTDMMAGLGYTFTNNSLSSRIARMLYKIGLYCSQHLFLLNEENVKEVSRLRLCNEKKIIWLKGGEGVDVNHYRYFDNSSEEICFLFIGRLIEEKGYREFVKAAKMVLQKYPNVQFHIVGEYDLSYPKAVSKEEVTADTKEANIDYLGVYKDMMELYKQPGYVVCIPSYYSEGLNRSLMEGCAVGKPIITTNHPGCKEMVVDGENGFVVETRNVEALVRAMEKYIVLSEEDKRKMSLRSRSWAEQQFDVKNVIIQYERLVHAEFNE
ncbi:glycosyltransferase family 4 protein [Hoylesella shahii]|uniref:glycosyltransferase family 4 protein n=1 Tax=Hoylesella shahii TaxID=228603 RepID=UPI0028ED9179|nr:glycosyltransferase family 4 protein [Hoylesella shahii]